MIPGTMWNSPNVQHIGKRRTPTSYPYGGLDAGWMRAVSIQIHAASPVVADIEK